MKIMTLPLLLLLAAPALAQQPQIVKQNGYTLTVINDDPTFDAAEQQRLVTTFFTVYPKLAKEYNKNTLKEVYFKIDTAYKGVAETDNGHVLISSAWLHKRPEDIDVVTHEVMHIVQDYKQAVGPGWLTEGIADYARYKFGINNEAAKWALPEFKPTQSYENSYRITARFLAWIENHHKKGIVKILDASMREHTFTDDIWKKETGKTLDELWAEYKANPVL